MTMLTAVLLVFSAYIPATCRYSACTSSILMSIFLLQKLHYRKRPLAIPQDFSPKFHINPSRRNVSYVSLLILCVNLEKKKNHICIAKYIHYFFREPFKYACRNISKHINLKEMLNHLSVKLRSSIHAFIIIYTQTFLTVLLQKI